MTTKTAARPLHLQILQHFSLEQLKELAGAFGVDWAALPGRPIGKCRALLEQLESSGKISQLVAYLQKERPAVRWQDFAAPQPKVMNRRLARDRRLLHEYMRAISDDLVNHKLLEAGPGTPTRSAVLEKTRSLFCKVDGRSKAEIVDFLYRSGLLTQKNAVYLESCDLSHADLSRANLSGVCLQHANLNSANLEGANLVGADLRRASLVNARLAGARLVDANLVSADFTGADLARADLTGASLIQANLSGAQLKDALLQGIFLNRSNLAGLDLSGADLKDANLSYAILKNAILRGTNFAGANLREADLTQADLTGACFTEANLYGAKLNRSILSDAVFDQAILDLADLTGTTIALEQIHQASIKLGFANSNGRRHTDWSQENTQPLLLIVEADPDMAEMLNAYFGVHGYEAYSVGWGEDAVRFCARHEPDLVLLDIHLPDIDGFEVARRLRSGKQTRNTPIIFLTDRSNRSDRMLAFEIEADDYCAKPFDIQELYLRMRNALRRSSGAAFPYHPTTGLPQMELVEERLKDCLHKDGWAISLISIQNLDDFRERYGFIAADDALRAASLMIVNTLRDMGQPDGFVGHLGNAEFIVITCAGEARAIGDRIAARLEPALEFFYPLKDRAAIQAEWRLSIRLSKVEAGEGPFENLQEIKSRLADEHSNSAGRRDYPNPTSTNPRKMTNIPTSFKG